MNESMNQWNNESINQTNNQWTNESINRSDFYGHMFIYRQLLKVRQSFRTTSSLILLIWTFYYEGLVKIKNSLQEVQHL